MSAAVCGSKRAFFEDIPPSLSPPVSKRTRCSSSVSPIRLFSSSLLDHLIALFPGMEPQLLERTLEECSNDLDAAIKCLHELGLGSSLGSSISSEEQKGNKDHSIPHVESSEGISSATGLPLDGGEWINLFVKEMMSSTSLDDARNRAGTALEILEKSISARASVEAIQTVHKENLQFKEQIDVLLRDNAVLKRAVAVQHERQKDYESRSQESNHLKQLVSQYQEQLRTLEINNYALTMHLKQAQQSYSIPGRFHPDIF